MTTTLPEFKTGSTFAVVVYVSTGGVATDFTGYTATSQVRTVTGTLVASPTVTVNDPETGYLTVLADAEDTVEWPVGTLETDVRLVAPDGSVIFSPTAVFKSTRPETRP